MGLGGGIAALKYQCMVITHIAILFIQNRRRIRCGWIENGTDGRLFLFHASIMLESEHKFSYHLENHTVLPYQCPNAAVFLVSSL